MQELKENDIDLPIEDIDYKHYADLIKQEFIPNFNDDLKQDNKSLSDNPFKYSLFNSFDEKVLDEKNNKVGLNKTQMFEILSYLYFPVYAARINDYVDYDTNNKVEELIKLGYFSGNNLVLLGG